MKVQIFLIRGLIRESGHWGEFLEQLQKQQPNAEIICLEAPGNGVYNKVKSPLRVKNMVKKMRGDYLQTINPTATKVVLATSLGGMIATEWMRTFKKDFDSAILINTSFRGLSRLNKRLRLSSLRWVLRVPFAKGIKREQTISKFASNRTDRHQQLSELWHSIQQKRKVKLKNTLRQLFAASIFTLKKFIPQVPVLIVTSKNDQMVCSECSQKISEYWKCPIVIHETAGHDLSSDEPEWLAEKTKNWIENLK